MKKLITGLLILILFSCEKLVIESSDQVFVIEKGKHQGFPVILESKGYSLVRDWVLTEDHIYEHNNDNQWDWNKLNGLVYEKFSNAHEYSCRIGWRWNTREGMFELSPYIYENGERIMHNNKGWFVEANEPFRVAIYDRGSYWRMIVENEDWTIRYTHEEPKESRCDGKYKELIVYFGGDEVTPHRMTFESRLITMH